VDFVSEVVNRDYPARRPEPGVVSLQTAINGLPIDHYETLDMKTAPGFPFIKTRPPNASGKKYLFDEIDGEYFPKGVLESLLKKLMDGLANGQMVSNIWINCTKDERRALLKILAGSTRTFCIAGVDFTIAGRAYFMDFIAALESDPTKSFCAVGIDADGPDWTDMYNRLASISENGCAIDYAAFDGKIPAQFMEAVVTIVNRWYSAYSTTESPATRRARTMLMEDVINAKNIAVNTLYQKHQGNPSGFFMTTISNCVVGFLYIVYCWRTLCNHPDRIEQIDKFESLVALYDYGDDLIMSISNEVSEWFNQITISQVLQGIGITCTTASKDAFTCKTEPIKDLTFLKRGFRPHERFPWIMKSPIAIPTITELPMWLKGASEDEQVKDHVIDALHFAYHHGKEFFNWYKLTIFQFCQKQGLLSLIPSLTYADCETRFLSKFQMNPRNVSNELVDKLKAMRTFLPSSSLERVPPTMAALCVA